jgi:hypothetical protein
MDLKDFPWRLWIQTIPAEPSPNLEGYTQFSPKETTHWESQKNVRNLLPVGNG